MRVAWSAGRAAGDEVEMLAPTIAEALAAAKLQRSDVGFTVSGSCDYLGGRPFSFVTALDAVGAWPPIRESHVEMDGAWALYEAWVALQHGDFDVALVYAFGRSTQGDLHVCSSRSSIRTASAPLGVDAVSLAALQARAMIDRGRCSERDIAGVVARSRGGSVDDLLRAPYVAAPLRAHDCGPPADARRGGGPRGGRSRPRALRAPRVDPRHRPPHRAALARRARPLASPARPSWPAKRRTSGRAAWTSPRFDAPFAHQEHPRTQRPRFDRRHRGEPLRRIARRVAVHRLGPDPHRRGGARRSRRQRLARAVAHATSGPCLQQNLVCVLEAR